MFMVFPHDARSKICPYIVWVTSLLCFCLLLELSRAFLTVVLQESTHQRAQFVTVQRLFTLVLFSGPFLLTLTNVNEQ